MAGGLNTANVTTNITTGALCGDTIVLALRTAELVFNSLTAVTKVREESAELYAEDPLAELRKIATEHFIDPIKGSVLDTFRAEPDDAEFEDGQLRNYLDTTLSPTDPTADTSPIYFDIQNPANLEMDEAGNTSRENVRSKPPLEDADECGRQPFVGTFAGPIDSASAIAGAVASNVSKPAVAAASAVGAVLSRSPDAVVGLGCTALGNANRAFGLENILIERVLDLADTIIEVTAEIGPENYTANHFLLTLMAQKNLLAADEVLAQEETYLLRNGGATSNPVSENAELFMKRAEDLLCGLDIFPSVAGFNQMAKLIGALAEMRGIRKLLEVNGEETAKLAEDIPNFEINFSSKFTVTNYFGSALHRIRCEIRKIVAEMDEAQRANDLIQYLTLEKIWCVKVKALRGFMRIAVKAPADVVNDFLGSDIGKDFLNVIQPTAEVQEITLGDLLTSIDNFTNAATLFLRRKGNVFNLQVLRTDIENQGQIIAQRRNTYSAVEEAASSIPGVEQGIAIAQTMMSAVAGIKTLGRVAKGLQNADWDVLFSAKGPFDTSLNGLAAVSLAQAQNCCASVQQGVTTGDAALSALAVDQLDALTDFFIDGAREEAIAEEAAGGFVNNEKAAIAEEKQSIKERVRALDAVRSAPCFSG